MKSSAFPSILIILLVLIAVVNALATFFYWYWRLRWFDMPMHFLGGVWVSGLVIWFRYFSNNLLVPPQTFRELCLIGAGVAFLVGLGWEVYELAMSVALGGHINAMRDTLSDLCFDVLGGIFSAGVVWWTIKNK